MLRPGLWNERGRRGAAGAFASWGFLAASGDTSDPMTIFERYVFRQAGVALLVILLSLSSIVWVALALRQLNVVTSQGQNVWMLFKMTTLALPNLMAIIAPFSLLIAAIHTLNRLNGDSELIVLTASGATVWTAARPLLFLAALVAIGVGFVNHLAMPWSMRLLRDYVVQVRTDILTQVIQPGQFSSPEPSLTFHIRERALNGELLGLIVHDTREKSLSQSYLAEHGVIVNKGATSYLVMSDGHIVRRTDKDEPAQIIVFEKYAVDLDRFEKKMDDGDDLKPRERYWSELVHPEANSANYKSSPGKFRAELHEALFQPALPLRVRDDRACRRRAGALDPTGRNQAGVDRLRHRRRAAARRAGAEQHRHHEGVRRPAALWVPGGGGADRAHGSGAVAQPGRAGRDNALHGAHLRSRDRGRRLARQSPPEPLWTKERPGGEELARWPTPAPSDSTSRRGSSWEYL